MSGTYEAGDLITRVYSNFRGVDFRGQEVNKHRAPHACNVWKDYKEIDSVRTRPGMRLHTSTDSSVRRIFFYNGQMLVICTEHTYGGYGDLYKVENGTKKLLYSGVRAEANAFVFGGIFYLFCRNVCIQYDGEIVSEVVGYVPTTSIARKPSGGGTIYEDVNMLSDYRINTFLADGGSFDFYLDVKNIDTDFVPVVTVDDVVVSNYTVDYAKGLISFTAAPDAPKTDGQDNVSVKFKKAVDGYRDSILKCTLHQVFDNRVFFSGNSDHPTTVWHCSLNDPTYISDLDYYEDGQDNAPITGMVAGNNALWVFRESSDANTTVFYHVPTIDDEYGKIYPSTHSSIATGCIYTSESHVSKAVNFNDDIVFFSKRGLEGISGDVTTEQVVAHRSTLVDPRMNSEYYFNDMILAEWEGYLLVIMRETVYLADSRATFTNGNHTEYEWFYWQLPRQIQSATVYDGVLYLGAVDGVYTLTGTDYTDFDNRPISSVWETPKDNFDNPNRLKTTHKRGFEVEGTGEFNVHVVTEKITEPELISTHKDVTDYFVGRIKLKKFKDLQIHLQSHTGFSLEKITIEAFVGGYIKR